MIIKNGVIEIKNPFTVKEFDGDMGWVIINIPAGFYEYRIKNINGWLPQQILLNGEWVDLGGQCPEVNAMI